MFVATMTHPARAASSKFCVPRILVLRNSWGFLNAAVHMAFGSKVNHHIKAVVGKQTVDKRAVANVAFHEKATLIVDVAGNGSQISGISEQIEHHNAHMSYLPNMYFT